MHENSKCALPEDWRPTQRRAASAQEPLTPRRPPASRDCTYISEIDTRRETIHCVRAEPRRASNRQSEKGQVYETRCPTNSPPPAPCACSEHTGSPFSVRSERRGTGEPPSRPQVNPAPGVTACWRLGLRNAPLKRLLQRRRARREVRSRPSRPCRLHPT